MTKVAIIDKREIPSTSPERIGKFDAMITYRVDRYRTYLVMVPNEELGGPNEDQVVADAIAADLAERERWANKEIEV